MKHENAHIRGRGDIGGPGLPTNSGSNHEAGMDKSMPDTGMGALKTGFTDMGSIAADTGSDPARMCPGENNKGRANRA